MPRNHLEKHFSDDTNVGNGFYRRKIRLIESNTKCVIYLKKIMCQGTLGRVHLSEAPSPPRFCLGW
jgi:hypothetical protein